MTGAELAQVITALAAFVGAVGSVISILVSRSNAAKISVVKQVVDDVAVKTDGLTTKLVETTNALGDAKEQVARHEGGDVERAKQETKEATQSIQTTSDEPLGKPIGVIRKK